MAAMSSFSLLASPPLSRRTTCFGTYAKETVTAAVCLYRDQRELRTAEEPEVGERIPNLRARTSAPAVTGHTRLSTNVSIASCTVSQVLPLPSLRTAGSMARSDLHSPFFTGKEVYFVGLIDILCEYGLKKQLEHHYKAAKHGEKVCSRFVLAPQSRALRRRDSTVVQRSLVRVLQRSLTCKGSAP